MDSQCGTDMARKKQLTIGYADFETTNKLDIKAETGYDVVVDGNDVVLMDDDGNIVGVPEVRVKCAGLLVRFPDGSKNGCVVDTVEELLEKVVEWKVDRLYFHNLKFDDSYIGCVLQDREVVLGEWTVKASKRLMNDRGMVYSDTIEFIGGRNSKTHRKKKHVCDIWDSAKIWASPLASIGKTFGVTKIGEKGEEALRVGCDLRMRAYCIRDCRVMMTAMEFYFEQCRVMSDGERPYGWMTAGSTAYNLFMKWSDKHYGPKKTKTVFPAVNEENGFPDWMREGYKGATPLLDPAIRNKVLEDLKVYDVNSMHPSRMDDCPLPAGKPKKVYDLEEMLDYGDRGYLWIAKVRMRADVKEGHRPTYMLKRRDESGETLCAHIDDWRGYGWDRDTFQVICSADMTLLERDYENIHIELMEGLVFRAYKGYMSGFITSWYKIKQEAGLAKNHALKAFAKLILNSLYGKFGTHPEHRGAHYEYEDDVINIVDDEEVEVDKIPKYLPVAMFITAYARDMISVACNALGWDHVAYTDTDSVHVYGLTNEECKERLESAGFEIDPDKLGCFDYESRWRYGVYVRNKGYFHFVKLDKTTGEPMLKNGKVENEIKMAGVNGFEGIEKVEDVAGKVLYGTQLGAHRVKGGMLLMERLSEIDVTEDCIKSRKKVKGMNAADGEKWLDMKRKEVLNGVGC